MEIKAKAEIIKQSISEYISDHKSRVADFIDGLQNKQRGAETLINSIQELTSTRHITEQIQCYTEQKQAVDNLVSMELGECKLTEKFIKFKGGYFTNQLKLKGFYSQT